jgi:two-component system sensor histidine kinase UhpB
MSVTIAGPNLVGAMPRDITLGTRTAWRRLSLRAKLLLVFILVDLIAGFVIGGVTILRARSSTRVEIAASMGLAETLVAEAINLAQQQSVNSLAEHIPRQRLMRHVRLSVRNAAHLPVAIGPQPGGSDAARSPAPTWFEALIAPPVERRELPIVVGGQSIGSVLITGVADDEIAEAWENFVALTTVGTGLNIAVIVLLYVLFGRVLGPLTELTTGLRDLEARNYNVRLARPDARELGAIADRFNSLAQALDRLRAENSELNRRLISAQDDERRHTALELHDEVGPSLFGLKANANSIAEHASSQGMAERARDMLAIIDHLQAINRNLLNRLRPMALGHVPLGDLLSELARERARQHTDMRIAFAASAVQPSYGEPVDLTIYRCVQEGLTNAIRHAQATGVDIALGEADGALNLRIEDDGCGIGASPMGRGLTGMQERVQALGGRCAIESAPGRGTRLRIAIPVAGPDARSGA